MQATLPALLAQSLPQQHPGRQIHHRNLGDLADERDGPARSRIRLDDVHVVAVDHVLDVEEAAHTQAHPEPPRVLHDVGALLLGQRGWRIDGDAVARVDASPLDVLHDPWDQDILTVADRIDLDLAAFQILVYQDRAPRGDLGS